MDINLEKMELFFEKDLKIKELLVDIAPTYDDSYNIAVDYYINKFLKTLKEIKFHFDKIIETFNFGDDVREIVDSNFKKYELRALRKVYEFKDLQDLYEDCCSSMDSELLDEVKKEFVGYFLFGRSLFSVLKSAKTINEMIHIFHSSIVNNENYYQSLNKQDIKINDSGYPIVLYGREDSLSKKVFDDFPVDMDAGITDIVGLKNNILIMVRDRGHALTIQIETSKNDMISVTYFIPKICNLEMVNNLKGLYYIDKFNKSYAMGSFSTTEENLSFDLNNFIGSVPMDADMDLSPSHSK